MNVQFCINQPQIIIQMIGKNEASSTYPYYQSIVIDILH